ncbi:MAG: hypothetical protein Q9161_002486 [Pseudevernia consocians]
MISEGDRLKLEGVRSELIAGCFKSVHQGGLASKRGRSQRVGNAMTLKACQAVGEDQGSVRRAADTRSADDDVGESKSLTNGAIFFRFKEAQQTHILRAPADNIISSLRA